MTLKIIKGILPEHNKENNMKKDIIITATLKLAKEHGLINLTRKMVCDEAGVADGSFPHIMGQTFTSFIATLDKDTELHEVSKKRLSKDVRKDHILRVALVAAKEFGYTSVTRNMLAERAKVSPGLVTHYFASMVQLKRAIMRAAVEHKIPEIVAQGLSMGDKNAQKASPELKALAATVLVNM